MAKVAISQEQNIRYTVPTQESCLQDWPEYPFDTGTPEQPDVYALVRRVLYEYGADRANYGTPAWNPLAAWIKPGDRVFVLPNFVIHQRPGQSTAEFQAKCTHGSVLRAVLDFAAIATGDPTLVAFGNAPLQSCDYERVAVETEADKIRTLYHKLGNATVGPHDLRLLVAKWTRFGALIDRQLGDPQEAVCVDLGEDSLLDEFFHRSESQPLVRVGDYPPEETMAYHAKGHHVYVINRRLLEADVIISVPKLKTHQKVGITCALKGTVGTIARKECLAHHRRGGPENGGDEYPHLSYLRHLASLLADKAAGTGTDLGSNIVRVASKVLSKALRTGSQGIMGGAWHGNDTAWRMTLDIARVLRFARLDGTLSQRPLRQHIAFIDGIVAGEGEGPLLPTPRSLGTLLFGPDICAVDAACALAMGYDPLRIPLVTNSFSPMSFPLTDESLDELQLSLNGSCVSPMDIVQHFQPAFAPPKGWRGAIELSTGKGSQLERVQMQGG